MGKKEKVAEGKGDQKWQCGVDTLVNKMVMIVLIAWRFEQIGGEEVGQVDEPEANNVA